jgi:hypothetical protein
MSFDDSLLEDTYLKRRGVDWNDRRRSRISATIPVLCSQSQHNELLLDGKLELGEYGVKSYRLPWDHRGPTLLWSFERVTKPSAKAYSRDYRTSPRNVIIGVGNLVDVRKLTKAEMQLISQQHPLGYFFTNLKRFVEPVPFTRPLGTVHYTDVPISLVADALKTVGILEVNGTRI